MSEAKYLRRAGVAAFWCRALVAWLILVSLASAQTQTDSSSAPPSPEQSIAAMTVPPGFKITTFAAEPDVVRPIGFCIDDRGRLWVAEALAFPHWASEGHDRITILEDTNGDGHFDKRTVFYDKLNYVSGVQIGFGGVWVCSAPNLLFIPDRNGDDVPDGPPEILLDGWSPKGIHDLFNGPTWGPDGWLYGGNAIGAPCNVGKPGAPDSERIQFTCGIWRYHPTRHKFEMVCHGTDNPWGIDFDEHGQMFISNNVLPHLWHVILGANYKRIRGEGPIPHTYAQIGTIADHLHWGGGDWSSSRGGEGIHSIAGGGHSHSGAMIYLGDQFPSEYRGTIFICNTHGSRINNDSLERKGSGFVGHHRPDFLISSNKWFHGVAIQQAPDGSAYFSHWLYTGECHAYHTDATHGRICKLTYGNPKPSRVDLLKLSDAELVKLQLDRNEWLVRHARRILQERGGNPAVHKSLLKILNDDRDPVHKLRALWTLHVTGGLNEKTLLAQLVNPDEYVRAWSIQFLAEDKRPSQVALKQFAALAKSDPSPVVHLYLASAMQRTPPDQRWPVINQLVAHVEDADDQNLPLMYWYATEALVPANPERALTLGEATEIPLLREYITRRIASLAK